MSIPPKAPDTAAADRRSQICHEYGQFNAAANEDGMIVLHATMKARAVQIISRSAWISGALRCDNDRTPVKANAARCAAAVLMVTDAAACVPHGTDDWHPGYDSAINGAVSEESCRWGDPGRTENHGRHARFPGDSDNWSLQSRAMFRQNAIS